MPKRHVAGGIGAWYYFKAEIVIDPGMPGISEKEQEDFKAFVKELQMSIDARRVESPPRTNGK
ncbi:MAG: hypothetical protein AAB658_04375 [Chloroflexota bacterium]